MKFPLKIAWVETLLQKKLPVFAVAMAGFVLIFRLDQSAAEKDAFYLFYYIPIILTAWFVGSRSAYLVALLCSWAWYQARMNLVIPPDLPIMLWNTLVRLASFAFIAWVMNLLKDKQQKMIALQAQLKKLLDREKQLARHDSLTGALNSRAFHEKLEEERNRSERYRRSMSMLYLDLDGFKKLNDTRGHECGDEVLKELVTTIQGKIRDVDVLARLGGDEFVVLLPETEMKGVQACAQRVMDAFKRSKSQGTTLSVGAVHYHLLPATNDEAVQAADQAMYKAKKSGKNKMVCDVYNKKS